MGKLGLVHSIRERRAVNADEHGIRLRVVLIAAAILGIPLLHQLPPIAMLHWHNLFQHLYYLPVVIAAFNFGWRGGLVAALLSGAMQIPHIVFTWGRALNYSEDLIWEIPAFVAAGVLAGIAAERDRNHQKALERTTAQLTKVYQELQ